MDVKEVALDTVYATIGLTAITAQQVQHQAASLRSRVEDRRTERREQVQQAVATTRERLEAQREQVQGRVGELVDQAKTRIEEIGGKANLSVPQIPADLSGRIQTRLEQVRTHVSEIAGTVRTNAQKLVQRAA